MIIKHSQMMSDFLMQMLPELKQRLQAGGLVDAKAARSLYAIWRDNNNHVKDGVYRRPATVSKFEVETMQGAGLVRSIGDRLEVTKKGSDVIKVMILGDDSSIFDDTGEIIDYSRALAKTKSPTVRTARSIAKKASSDWWSRYEAENG